jgi:hypothetical protein
VLQCEQKYFRVVPLERFIAIELSSITVYSVYRIWVISECNSCFILWVT